MKLLVLFGQRQTDGYEIFLPEALACMTESDNDVNPQYLNDEYSRAHLSQAFSALRIITLSFSEMDLSKQLTPPASDIKTTVEVL